MQVKTEGHFAYGCFVLQNQLGSGLSTVMQILISFMDNVGVSSQEPLTLAKVSSLTEKKCLFNIHIGQHPLHLVILLAIFLTVYSIAMVMNFYADLRLAIFYCRVFHSLFLQDRYNYSALLHSLLTLKQNCSPFKTKSFPLQVQ